MQRDIPGCILKQSPRTLSGFSAMQNIFIWGSGWPEGTQKFKIISKYKLMTKDRTCSSTGVLI